MESKSTSSLPRTHARSNISIITSESAPLLENLTSSNSIYESTENVENWQDREDSVQFQPQPSSSFDGGDLLSTVESSIQNSTSLCVGTLNLVSQRYESLDYDICENVLFLEEQKKSIAKVRGKDNSCPRPWRCIKNTAQSTEVLRWIVIIIIAVLTAITGCLITMVIDELSALKFRFLKKLVDESRGFNDLRNMYAYWLIFCSCSVAFGSVLVTFIAPVAAGSGIPVIKCYLNGVKVPEVVRIKTLIVKAIGVVTSVVGGLAVGKEGPMIHCGAVIAAGISQGKSTTFRKDCKIFEKFREDHEKRDFVSAGAAAGVAAAFGAPVGGVLFSLEEGASFWNQSLTWRIFFGSMVSYFTLNLILSYYHNHPGQLSYSGLINFGKFDDIDYSVYELPMYIVMGAIGGLLGAGYNQLNFKLTVFRLRYVKNRVAKVVEAVIVSMVGVGIAFITIITFSDCQTLNDSTVNFAIQLNCSENRYSSFATIWFQTPESSLRSLFHDPEGSWSPLTLGIFFILYYLLGCWTYGLSISSGLFIPTLLIGAAWGRLAGVGLYMGVYTVGFYGGWWGEHALRAGGTSDRRGAWGGM